MRIAVDELFVNRLQAMLFVEETLANDVLPLFYEHVHGSDLKYGIERHTLETKEHAVALRGMLHDLGAPSEPVVSPVLLGLMSEHDALMEEFPTDSMHAWLIAQGEHVEIAAYTWLRSTANALGHEAMALRLQEILEQEEYALELAEKALAKHLAETVTD
jgi:ferritin-like metal-binding protein YciE